MGITPYFPVGLFDKKILMKNYKVIATFIDLKINFGWNNVYFNKREKIFKSIEKKMVLSYLLIV